MKKSLFVLLFALIAVQPAMASTPSETTYARVLRTGVLRCGYSHWPPFFSIDPNTKAVSGVSKDFSDAAAKILGIRIEYIEITVGQQVQDLNNGKIDAVCGDGPWVLSTLRYIDYTKPYYYVPEYLYARADEKRFAAPEDLNRPDVTFTAIDGDVSTDIAQDRFPKAKLNSMGNLADPSQLLLNVVTKKADVVITDPAAFTSFAKSNPNKIKVLFPRPVAVYGGGFSVKKGESDLLNMLNGTIDVMVNTGQAETLAKKNDPEGKIFLQVAPPYARPLAK